MDAVAITMLETITERKLAHEKILEMPVGIEAQKKAVYENVVTKKVMRKVYRLVEELEDVVEKALVAAAIEEMVRTKEEIVCRFLGVARPG